MLLLVVLKFIDFERERERERESTCAHVSRGGAEREGERIPSRLCTVNVEPKAGLSLQS